MNRLVFGGTAAERLTRGAVMHNLGTAERVDPVARLAVEDEELANQSPVRLLITAPTAQAVERLARRC